MSKTLNKSILVGNIARNPRLDYTENGTPVCNATVVTNDKNDKTQFTDIVLWNKSAELFAEMVKQGSRVYVEGYINTYTNSGTQRTEVVVSDFVVLDRLESITAKFIEDSLGGEFYE